METNRRWLFGNEHWVKPISLPRYETPIDDLLKKQREGKQLTLSERQQIKAYNEKQRIKNKKHKKNP